jgi:carboxyl-terminal processing protease
MRHSKIKSFALVTVLCALVVTGCLTAQKTPPPAAAVKTAIPVTTGLSPGPDDGRIAYITAQLMENIQYSQHPLDTEMSEKFFDGYMDSLDPRHENFLQSDLAEFLHYRTNLDTLTVVGQTNADGRVMADLRPAYEIFQRFLKRLQQHGAYTDELLKQDNFKFTTDERILLDRRHAPYPKDLAEAHQLWEQWLRYDYLMDKLSREISQTNGNKVLPLPKTANTNILDTLAQHNRWLQRTTTNLDSDFVLSTYLNALTHAYDPHSDYFTAPHAQDFSINMSLSLFGIGAQLREEDGNCKIDGLVPGGPAQKSKQLNPNDYIVAVAQSNSPPVDVVDMELDKVVQLIRGPKGTQVQLTISPATDHAARHVVNLVRDEIKLEDSEAKSRLIEMPDSHGGTNRLGIIDLPSFYATIPLSGNDHSTPKFASVDTAKLVKKLKQEKVSGIIIDLRTNPGGSLEEAIKFTGLFIKNGPVVQTRNYDGKVTVDSNTDSDELYSGPLVVLINRFSASAAEIAAAALQDYGRALVVGDTSTHGKGTVQQLRPLNVFTPEMTSDPGTLKVTISKFYRVSGASTQLKGVVPDIILPSILNYSDQVGETSLDNPLPYDTNAPANFDKLNLVEPYLATLRQQSDQRIATNVDFTYIRQDIDQFKKLQADKTATLNEQVSLKERIKDTERNDARDAERAVRPLPQETIYENTVENAELPGLPAPEPLTATNENVLLIATNENGSVSMMSTNNAIITGILSSQIATVPAANHVIISGILSSQITNAPAANPHFGNVITKTQPVDPTLDEAEHILEDYISLLSKNGALIADH